MKKYAVVLCMVFMSTNAFADTLTFAVGKDTESEKKILQLTYSYVPFKNSFRFLSVDGTLGTYHRYDFLAGVPSSYMGELGVGVEARNSVLYAKIGQSISYGTRPMHFVSGGVDTLREKLQYGTKISAGIAADHVNLGLFFKHYSDGKHSASNGCGVNFIGFELGYVL